MSASFILRGCVKTLTQPFFMRKAQTFSSPGFVITQSFRIFKIGRAHV